MEQGSTLAGRRTRLLPDEVVSLRGSFAVEHTIARRGAERLWDLVNSEDYVAALGALTGGQAVEMVKAGLKAIYLSGWQVAADANLAGQTYPDQSLYPANSVPAVVRRINNALQRADPDRVERRQGSRHVLDGSRSWPTPKPGSAAPLNAFELMRSMIEAGAAGVHFEDQLASEKKCGHLGGKVLVPTEPVRPHAHGRAAGRRRARRADGARRAHRRAGAPRCSRATSTSATASSSRASGPPRASSTSRTGSRPRSRAAWPTRRTPTCCGARPRRPDLDEARAFAEAIHAQYPGQAAGLQLLAVVQLERKHLDDATIARFQKELGAMGYRFQFITLAGFHALNASMFELAHGYAAEGMTAYVRLQEREFEMEEDGYTGDAPPGRGRHRLLRQGLRGDLGRYGLDARAQGLDGRGAVPPRRRTSTCGCSTGSRSSGSTPRSR